MTDISTSASSRNYARNAVLVGVGATIALLVLWGLLRADRVAYLNEVPADVVTAAQAALPSIQMPFSLIEVKYLETLNGDQFTRKQTVEAVSSAALRRDSKRYHLQNQLGVLEETSSIFIGPLRLVTHYRAPLPFIGDLLPSHFWTTRVLQRIEAAPSRDFPLKVGSTFNANLWTEVRYSSGESMHVEPSMLSCVSGERVEAKRIHATLTGYAIKIRCDESWPPLKTDNGATSRAESWFIEELSMSFQVSYIESTKYGDDLPSAEQITQRSIESLVVGRKKSHQ